ncbi:MAG TPA: hypothetical protein VM888_08695 [Chitinophagaceae bacterium]|nr:hypothetical protein [Chitinophagaceae bacterium]
MRGALIALLIGILLLTLCYLSITSWFRATTVDIHIHDTYYIITYRFLIIFIILFLGTLFSLGGSISTAFRHKYFLIFLFAFTAADIYFIIKLVNGFS